MRRFIGCRKALAEEARMCPANEDLTIDAVLRDPLIRSVMTADRVTATDFEQLLRTAASGLDALPREPATVSLASKASPARGFLPRFCFA